MAEELSMLVLVAVRPDHVPRACLGSSGGAIMLLRALVICLIASFCSGMSAASKVRTYRAGPVVVGSTVICHSAYAPSHPLLVCYRQASLRRHAAAGAWDGPCYAVSTACTATADLLPKNALPGLPAFGLFTCWWIPF